MTLHVTMRFMQVGQILVLLGKGKIFSMEKYVIIGYSSLTNG